MKTIEVKSSTGEILFAQEITNEELELDLFDIRDSDYMIQIAKEGLKLKVTNAVDGWGRNCRDLFEGATIDVY